MLLVAIVAAILFIAVSPSRWYERFIPPASTRQGGEWSPAPEPSSPAPRRVRISWRGIFVRVCGAIIVSFLLFPWFFLGDTFYEGTVHNPQGRVFPFVAVAFFSRHSDY